MYEDAAEAARIAREAGALLMRLRAERGASDPKELRVAGDRMSHELIAAELAAVRPGDAVLSEEGEDDGSRLGAARVWIVDPLDGTREFGEPGRGDFAVHLALVSAGRLAAGVVCLPAMGVVLTTADPPAAARASSRTRVAVSRSRATEQVLGVARAIGAEVVPMGSAGAKAAAVVMGEVDAYLHSGGMHEWDAAAPVAVALASGQHASRLDGSPLRFNQVEPEVPDLLICRPELAVPITDAARGG